MRYGGQILQWLDKGAAVLRGGLSPVFIVVPKTMIPGALEPMKKEIEREVVECLEKAPAVRGGGLGPVSIVVPKTMIPGALEPTKTEMECEVKG